MRQRLRLTSVSPRLLEFYANDESSARLGIFDHQ
ncbi:hypothetical protein SM11_pC1058 (plasmid) [Sinorhizobium meliloti SM11]|uniref:Uncharacterized protein n=1 Tax=Sinorhizobium meliloti (strain SM11) TaxID=707241 RepID=F7XF06_SINMM|nr:hypothetical protein SM11_pC1058 [Sinorhizobium meliloti SM11]